MATFQPLSAPRHTGKPASLWGSNGNLIEGMHRATLGNGVCRSEVYPAPRGMLGNVVDYLREGTW